MDYYGMPHIKSNLKPEVICIDVVNKKAALPGNGKTLVTFTYSFDVARFVVKALDLEEWPREMRVVGETLAFEEVLGVVEDVIGESSPFPFDLHATSFSSLLGKGTAMVALTGPRRGASSSGCTHAITLYCASRLTCLANILLSLQAPNSRPSTTQSRNFKASKSRSFPVMSRCMRSMEGKASRPLCQSLNSGWRREEVRSRWKAL